VNVYVAGNGSSREEFQDWINKGAYGLQVGSRFALCTESGMRDDLRDRIIERNASGETIVQTSNRLSPTGYPFKQVPLAGTLSDAGVYEARKRICNKGYLLQSHIQTLPDGTEKETYICPAMPEKQYGKLGGDSADLSDRVCLCNALFSTAGLGEAIEPALVTLGKFGASVTVKRTAREIIEDLLTPAFVAAAEQRLTKTLDKPRRIVRHTVIAPSRRLVEAVA